MTRETYIGKAIKEMFLNGVTVSFIKRTNDSKHTYSCFDPTQSNFPKFILRYFSDDFVNFFNYFIHEYCHFKQWQEQTDIWKKGIQSQAAFNDYMDFYSDEFDLDKLLDIQLLEIDCEKRVLQEIKTNKLPVKVNEYIKESNSYIYSYNVMYEQRNFNDHVDYKSPDLLKYMPVKLLTKNNIQKRIPKYDEIYLSHRE